MPGDILPDPRLFVAAPDDVVPRVLHIHRTIPETVHVGHFEPGGIEVVDDVVSRSIYLDFIQHACATLGERLEVRFYDHDDDGFDASVLDHLGEIRSLSIDGLSAVRNADAVGRLPKLTSLRFGPWRIDDPRVLNRVGVERLVHFTLAGTPSPTIDLSPLGDARSMRTLRLLGSGKHPEAIGRLAQLVELAIQPSSKWSLGFINQLAALATLKLVLGNLLSLRSIDALPLLSDLSVKEVRNLEDLGDLERFPRLRRLWISDQPRITELRVGPGNTALEHLYLYSVPRLQALSGFSELPAVKSLFAYDSRVDLSLAELPRTLTHFQLMTKAVKGRSAHEAEIRASGLSPGVHPDSQFFYK
jgi:hypothetical protein